MRDVLFVHWQKEASDEAEFFYDAQLSGERTLVNSSSFTSNSACVYVCMADLTD